MKLKIKNSKHTKTKHSEVEKRGNAHTEREIEELEREKDGWVNDGKQKVKQITRPC